MATLRGLISAAYRAERERENEELLKAQGYSKTRKPKYILQKVEFNPVSRVTRIEFLEKKKYRTVERYITQDYEKFPVYSEWKTKEKIVKKTLKLTNSELENLNNNSDELVKTFAEDIIRQVNDESLFPSWFVKANLKKELNAELNVMSNAYFSFTQSQNSIIKEKKKIMEVLESNSVNRQLELHKWERKKNRLNRKLKRSENRKNNILKSIFSFGVYSYLLSKRHREKLNKNLDNVNQEMEMIDKVIFGYLKERRAAYNSILLCQSRINQKKKDFEVKKQKKIEEYQNKLSTVTSLPNVAPESKDFTMLKEFSGYTYEKIIGVYVIHNREKDKYYVGQSKDVMKRLKQHFNGTVPKNPIFAEDYYTSKMSEKENLFEVQITRCQTKDELDRTEKQLIYQFNSYENGYNGTNGNN